MTSWKVLQELVLFGPGMQFVVVHTPVISPVPQSSPFGQSLLSVQVRSVDGVATVHRLLVQMVLFAALQATD